MPDPADYELFILSVDDLDWTREWLGKLRCDSLLVWVAASPDLEPRIRIRAVESKSSTSATAIAPSRDTKPFDRGSDQVLSTIDALVRIIEVGDAHPLVEDLKFASFIEHLAAIALEQLHPIAPGDTRKVNICNTISDLSARRIPGDLIDLEAMVVCTQYRTASDIEIRSEATPRPGGRDLPLFLVRCGSDQVDQVLGSELGALVLPPGPESDSILEQDGGQDYESANGPDSDAGDSRPEVTMSQSLDEESVEQSQSDDPEDQGGQVSDRDSVIALASDLRLACRHRGIPVHEPDVEVITEGATLVVIPMRLEAGASIRTIDSSLADLAREVGVETVDVENDPTRPYHVRFLVARQDRLYPELPTNNAPASDHETESYLGFYLGQNVEGKDVVSYLSSWPHMLIAGTTGSGKTTFIHSVLRQLNRFDPRLVSAVIVDGKGEFDYEGVLDQQHFVSEFAGVQQGHDRTLAVMEWVVDQEIPRRRDVIAESIRNTENSPRNARKLFAAHVEAGEPPQVEPLLIVIDEFAELMQNSSTASDFEGRIQQVAQVGRSTLVHLLLATQRPDASVVRGPIKANLDARVALRLPSHHDSMTVLSGKGAERLLGNGDMLFQSSNQARIRLQGYRPPE